MVRKDQNLEENLKVMGKIILDIEDSQIKLEDKAVTPLMLGNINAAIHTKIDLLNSKLNQDLVYYFPN
jgi:hypothetical protein